MRQKNTPEIRKVLIIKGPGIGDVVTAVPLARNLKKIFGCEVHLLEEFPPEKQGNAVIKNCPYIDKIMRLNYSIWYFRPGSGRFLTELAGLKFIPDTLRFIRDIRKLRGEKYDLVFEGFPGTSNTSMLAGLAGGKTKACCGSHPNRNRYETVLDIGRRNIVEAENSIFGTFGHEVRPEDLRLEMFHDGQEQEKRAREICGAHGITDGEKIVAINTGHGYKKWQNHKWAELIGRTEGARIVLLGDSGQSGDAREIAAMCKKEVTDLTGRLTLEDTIGIMEMARLFICTNGGLMWISAALGKPTVVVSGPTPYWWDPHASNCKVVRKAGKQFYEQEKYSWLQNARTEDVTVEDVVRSVRELAGEMNEAG